MSVTIETPIHFTRVKAGRKKVAVGPVPENASEPPDPIPRISRLMALAIHFDGLIREGIVKDYADLARLGGVSRARITQIMNLLNLPPWKQEELLFLEGGAGRARVTERGLRQWIGALDGMIPQPPKTQISSSGMYKLEVSPKR